MAARTVMPDLRNWAANITFTPRRFAEPSSVDELRRLVHEATACRVIGTRHSFSTVAVTSGTLISLRRMPASVTVDTMARTATCSSQMTFAEVGDTLHAQGFALTNLPSLPQISICGAMCTATHGSGTGQPILAGAVHSFTYVSGDGALLTAGPGSAALDGLILGAVGAIVSVTLRVVPTFDIQQAVYGPVPWSVVDGRFHEIMHAAYSVSLFTQYGAEGCHQLWLKQRVPAVGGPALPATLFGLPRIVGPDADGGQVHPANLDGTNCTPQGPPGPWHERLAHFRADRPPSSEGAELQSEWFVPVENAVAMLRALRAMHGLVSPLLWVSEIRTVDADDLCLSPCCGRACVAVNFTWKPDEAAVRAALPTVEAALRPLGMLPHWGKLTSMTPGSLADAYMSGPSGARVRALAELLCHEDPAGKFAGEHVAAILRHTSCRQVRSSRL